MVTLAERLPGLTHAEPDTRPGIIRSLELRNASTPSYFLKTNNIDGPLEAHLGTEGLPSYELVKYFAQKNSDLAAIGTITHSADDNWKAAEQLLRHKWDEFFSQHTNIEGIPVEVMTDWEKLHCFIQEIWASEGAHYSGNGYQDGNNGSGNP